MGGEIDFVSEVNKGTIFQVRIPLKKGEFIEAKIKNPDAKAWENLGCQSIEKRVLVVAKPIRLGNLTEALQRISTVSTDGFAKKDYHEVPLFEPEMIEILNFVNPRSKQNLAIEVASAYLTTANERINSLILACKNGEAEQANRLSHSLKSSCQQVGLTRLGQLLSLIEQQAESGDLSNISSLADQLLTINTQSSEKLKSYLSSFKTSI